MCVGPSGLQSCGTAIEWTAWATVALAAVAAISIIVNSYLAWSTHKSAKSAKEQVGLERSQLALFQRQLELAEKQFNAAGVAALPRLQVTLTSTGPRFTEGTVTHAYGSQPAYDIEVWIRGQSREGESWGLRRTPPIGFLAAGKEVRFISIPASATDQERCPFKEFFESADPPPPGQFFVGWTWRRMDKTEDRLSSVMSEALGE